MPATMSGNRINATTLDLDRPFEEIRAQLDGIVEEYFPGSDLFPAIQRTGPGPGMHIRCGCKNIGWEEFA